MKVGLHVFIWLFLFTLPYLLLPANSVYIRRFIMHIWSPLIQYMVIFYINYFLLINRLWFTRKFVWFILINVGLIAALSVVNWYVVEFFMKMEFSLRISEGAPQPMMGPKGPGMPPPRPGMGPSGPSPKFFFVVKDVISYSIPLIFSIAVRVTERWVKTEAAKKEAENRHLESELIHLRYQLQPHFFFNSLNNIYSLIEKSPKGAQEAILDMSRLMRYLLYETGRERVELNQEILFLTRYIDLMKLRITDKTRVDYSFPEASPGLYVAPLLFIPLIENAFKHGVSATKESNISFSMSIREQQVHFLGRNTCFPKNPMDKSGSGIGLDNLKKRLDLIYPGCYILKTHVEGNDFLAILTIELD